MKYIAIALSDKGRIRKNNEDNLYFDGSFRDIKDMAGTYRKTLNSEEPVKLFAVSDGMGGEALGEQASFIAVSGLPEIEKYFVEHNGSSFAKLMSRYLDRVNQRLCALIRQNRGIRMGSTFVSALLSHGTLRTLNVGDSRAYIYRKGKLLQLSRDHNFAERLVEMGVIKAEEAKYHPERHRLYQHLGIFREEREIKPSVSDEIKLEENDLILLCSDGITEMLSDSQISSVLDSQKSFLSQGEKLVRLALDLGGKDNASLILIKILQTEDSEKRPEDSGELPDLRNMTFGIDEEAARLAADKEIMDGESRISYYREISPDFEGNSVSEGKTGYFTKPQGSGSEVKTNQSRGGFEGKILPEVKRSAAAQPSNVLSPAEEERFEKLRQEAIKKQSEKLQSEGLKLGRLSGRQRAVRNENFSGLSGMADEASSVFPRERSVYNPEIPVNRDDPRLRLKNRKKHGFLRFLMITIVAAAVGFGLFMLLFNKNTLIG